MRLSLLHPYARCCPRRHTYLHQYPNRRTTRVRCEWCRVENSPQLHRHGTSTVQHSSATRNESLVGLAGDVLRVQLVLLVLRISLASTCSPCIAKMCSRPSYAGAMHNPRILQDPAAAEYMHRLDKMSRYLLHPRTVISPSRYLHHLCVTNYIRARNNRVTTNITYHLHSSRGV